MSEIIRCSGQGCLLAFRCRRFTENNKEETPIFFADAPYKVVDGALSCAMFWGESQDSIYGQLKEITNGEDNTGGVKGDDIRGTEKDEQGA